MLAMFACRARFVARRIFANLIPCIIFSPGGGWQTLSCSGGRAHHHALGCLFVLVLRALHVSGIRPLPGEASHAVCARPHTHTHTHTTLSVFSRLTACNNRVVNQADTGMYLMSSSFQTSLLGDHLRDLDGPEHIAFGSVITFRSQTPGVGLLHSHPHLFPAPFVQQQQVTAYGHNVG